MQNENTRGEFRAQGLRPQLTILPPIKTAPVSCFSLVLNVSLFADNTLADALRLRKMRSNEKKVKRALIRENCAATIKGLTYLSYSNMFLKGSPWPKVLPWAKPETDTCYF